jgi:AcrR family transcriptional regulator
VVAVTALGRRRRQPARVSPAAVPTAPPPRRSAARKSPAAAERRTQTERREEAERRLLEAALEIVARRGSVRMTLAEVGEAAGYSRGLPAHRFGSKAGLVHALAGYIGERFGQQREQGPKPAAGLDAILGNIRFYFSLAKAPRPSRAKAGLPAAGLASARPGGQPGDAFTATRALLVMMTESCMEANAELRAEVAAYNRSALAWFEQHIRTGIERGEIAADNDPAITAVILLGAMRGVLLQWLVDDSIPLATVRDRLLRIAERVLRQP